MTYKIALEALGPLGADSFARLVAAHIAALAEYDAHLVKVRADAANPDLADDERHIEFPPPSAPAEVESAIRRTGREDGTTEFAADFEIVGPSLAQKKAKLFDLVSSAERAAINAVVPPGKIRAFQFREADIRKEDQRRYSVAVASLPLGSEPDFARFCDESRPITDTRFLDEQAAREDQRNEIYRWAAALHSDIEDLTDETADGWEMKPFHG